MTRETYSDLKKAIDTMHREIEFAHRRSSEEERGALHGFIAMLGEMDSRLDEFKPGRRKAKAVTS